MSALDAGRPLTVRDLRERLADSPDYADVYVETIVGGDLGTDDTPLVAADLTSDRDGYILRLQPDRDDPYRTRELIDDALLAREVVADLIDEYAGEYDDQSLIHTRDGDYCADDCVGCAVLKIVGRLKWLHERLEGRDVLVR